LIEHGPGLTRLCKRAGVDAEESPGRVGRGWLCLRDRHAEKYFEVVDLAEFQWLCYDGLFVMAPAAAETNSRREDDRASYEDTHRIPRSLVKFF
jgi:hypothetical protein